MQSSFCHNSMSWVIFPSSYLPDSCYSSCTHLSWSDVPGGGDVCHSPLGSSRGAHALCSRLWSARIIQLFPRRTKGSGSRTWYHKVSRAALLMSSLPDDSRRAMCWSCPSPACGSQLCTTSQLWFRDITLVFGMGLGGSVYTAETSKCHKWGFCFALRELVCPHATESSHFWSND